MITAATTVDQAGWYCSVRVWQGDTLGRSETCGQRHETEASAVAHVRDWQRILNAVGPRDRDYSYSVRYLDADGLPEIVSVVNVRG